LIDLHLHTSASDGRCDPAELVRRAWLAGVTVLSVTDHDTTAGLAESSVQAGRYGLELVAGIEVTAVSADGEDVHVLGYFIDPSARGLQDFLAAQRDDRIRRARAMGERLAALGFAVDLEPAIAAAGAGTGRAIGRPAVAAALVRAGHAASVRDAFDRLIGRGCPGYVPRAGASPEQVVRIIADAGGLASLAHPGLLNRDDLIAPLAAAGLPALEAFHIDHDPAAQQRYLALARAHDLAVTGGSDFHGWDGHRAIAPGTMTLPPDEFARLRRRAGRA
jgi:predicted metal-dependent phosphoesterase TrpH